jgi:hypothetical protein
MQVISGTYLILRIFSTWLIEMHGFFFFFLPQVKVLAAVDALRIGAIALQHLFVASQTGKKLCFRKSLLSRPRHGRRRSHGDAGNMILDTISARILLVASDFPLMAQRTGILPQRSGWRLGIGLRCLYCGRGVWHNEGGGTSSYAALLLRRISLCLRDDSRPSLRVNRCELPERRSKTEMNRWGVACRNRLCSIYLA